VTLWISGDTVLFDGVREVAERLSVRTAILHLGGVQFLMTGPLRYTMTAKDAVELCGLLRPRTAIPIHYEGWKHFREGREAIEQEFANAPDDIRKRVRCYRLALRWNSSPSAKARDCRLACSQFEACRARLVLAIARRAG
jgi:L-ascorbate metabolism protein UlaG (beta-lactamase superfamily)